MIDKGLKMWLLPNLREAAPGVSLFSQCLCRFSADSPASSNSPNTVSTGLISEWLCDKPETRPVCHSHLHSRAAGIDSSKAATLSAGSAMIKNEWMDKFKGISISHEGGSQKQDLPVLLRVTPKSQSRRVGCGGSFLFRFFLFNFFKTQLVVFTY